MEKNTSASISNQDKIKIIAEEILCGNSASSASILDLAKKLKANKDFIYARNLLAHATTEASINSDKNIKLKIYQEWSLCTYKDHELPLDNRLDKALEILNRIEDLDKTKNQETLGQAGAIYKNKWEVDNQRIHLERSLSYYQRGYQEGAETDQGYTGINTAFILDLLAFQEDAVYRKANISSQIAMERRASAVKIREEIIEKVPPLEHEPNNKENWWFYVTIAEAYFGVKKYEKAIEWLEKGKSNVSGISEWEKESTLRQLVRLTLIQDDSDRAGEDFKNTPAWNALQKFFGNDPVPVRNAFIGKIGLALSGGGFRASLFHIGTLAKLAELDVLRHVEVLSCVSGGSVIGSHYYLEVRKLLQSKDDKQITRQDYIKIVERLEEDFVTAIQGNLRMKLFSGLRANVKRFFSSEYSHTLRIGELYEKEIFSKVLDSEESSPRFLNLLNIFPKNESKIFDAKKTNWRRTAKVPNLIINATTLNTGHNWQFTTTLMGESPYIIDTDIDANHQLRRMSYAEAPDDLKNIRLGQAVAASTCVPGLFEPLTFDKNLYPNRTVRLVDGGVSDNQGITSLLEQDCRVILVSDGSGQMVSEDIPSSNFLGVPLRSNSILQSRIREAQYHDLEKRKRSSLINGLMYIHLKKDLDVDPIDWIGCQDKFINTYEAQKSKQNYPLTRYGVSKKIQKLLSCIRTDLDSFSDIEAFALMTSAYKMTDYSFAYGDSLQGFAIKSDKVSWNFLKVEIGMKEENDKYHHIFNLLSTSNSLFFKVIKQIPCLEFAFKSLKTLFRILFILIGIILITILIAVLLCVPDFTLIQEITSGQVALSLLVFVGIVLFVGLIKKIIKVSIKDFLLLTLFAIGTAILGQIIALIHLKFLDKLFLQRGSLEEFQKK